VSRRSPCSVGDTVLEVRDLVVYDDRKLEAVRGVSFSVREGEVVALAGVSGNGQAELVEALTGLRKVHGGSMRLKGRDITHAAAHETIEAGLSHVPEDRHRRGLVLDFDLMENTILGDHRQLPFAKHGVLKFQAIAEVTRKRIEDYDVRTPSEKVKAAALSGGNQQKLVLARELGRDPDVLVAAQPTRGLDVGAIEFVHNQILAERGRGKAVLLISLELEEVQSLADRILVIFEGRIVREFSAGEASDEDLGYYMTGAGGDKLTAGGDRMGTPDG
jgi:general nucleoside transport system ATP-binding protein